MLTRLRQIAMHIPQKTLLAGWVTGPDVERIASQVTAKDLRHSPCTTRFRSRGWQP